MDYLKQYKSFVNSYYLAEGIRITIGITLPAIVLSYLHHLDAGILVSIGALCASIPDNAGAIRHRLNAMLVCDALIFGVALCTGWATSFPAVLAILIFLLCFLFSMIGVYGARASSIGLAALLVMVLKIDRPEQGWNVVIHAAYILAGGIWYTLLSLSLYSFRPYKLAQQALGESIQSTADYLRLRGSFYARGNDPDKTYEALLDAQRKVHEKQNLVRELLFRSRDLVKESTDTGRVMVMIFLDVVDLFERVVTVHQDYKVLHRFFDGTGVLDKFQDLIGALADGLEEIGIAVKSGEVAGSARGLDEKIKKVKEYFAKYRDEHRDAANVEGFISLRHILENIEDIGDRLYTLQNYTTYDKKLSRNFNPSIQYEQFAPHENITPKLLVENLSLQSNTFRHSLRLSVATIAGYLVSGFLPFGHSYWILLTIIVILKPAYSLTKKRNYQRLVGTIMGALFGFAILFLLKDKTAVFIIMILLMIGAYSFMRINYLVFVSLMTPYILLMFHLLDAGHFRSVVADRIIDTLIGSGIAFVANIFLLPVWEHEQVTDYLVAMITGNLQYFLDVTAIFKNKAVSVDRYKLSRKNAFVSLANLSDVFNRMLSEPKNKQKNIQQLHQFVVAGHMLVSNIATLSLFTQQEPSRQQEEIFVPVVEEIAIKLQQSRKGIREGEAGVGPKDKNAMRRVNDRLNELLMLRRKELDEGITESNTRKSLSAFKPLADQFNFIYKAAADIEKLSTVFAASQS